MRKFRTVATSGRRSLRRHGRRQRVLNLGTAGRPVPASLIVPRRAGGLVVMPAAPSPETARKRFGLSRAGLATVRFDLQGPRPGPIVDVVRSAREIAGPTVPLSLYGTGENAAPSLEAAADLGANLAGVVARGPSISPQFLRIPVPTLLVDDGEDAERRAAEWLVRHAHTDDPETARALLALLGERSPLAVARRLAAVTAIVGGTLVLSAPPASAAVTSDVTGTTLTVTANAADNITITCQGGNIKVNGNNPDTPGGAQNCAPITTITVTATGAFANSIDLSGVTTTDYTSVTGVTINAGPGDDTVTGSPFADNILGDAGNDTITGGAGNDTINGGDGTDRVVESGDTNFTLTNSSLTGNGTDTLSNLEAAAVTGGAGNNNLNAGAFTGPVTLDGGAGNDTLTGGSAADSLTGGAGNDTLTGNAGNDTLAGGDGTDRVVESGDADFVVTNSSLTGRGTDTLSGIEEADLTGGGSGNSLNASAFGSQVTLSGAGGNDTLIGSKGNDNLQGGDGTDRVVQTAAGNQTLTNASLTGIGTDNLAGLEQAALTGDGGSNVINARGFSGDTTLIGGAGPDTLNGGSARDQILGQGGNDRQTGGPGGDTLRGGGGSDNLAGGGARDTINGGAGNDTLKGGPGADVLKDGPGKDVVRR
jgi:Ca2+-binding RTX toxin-like protein